LKNEELNVIDRNITLMLPKFSSPSDEDYPEHNKPALKTTCPCKTIITNPMPLPGKNFLK